MSISECDATIFTESYIKQSIISWTAASHSLFFIHWERRTSTKQQPTRLYSTSDINFSSNSLRADVNFLDSCRPNMNLHKFMHKNRAHRPTLCITTSTTYVTDCPDAIISTQAPLKTSPTLMSKVWDNWYWSAPACFPITVSQSATLSTPEWLCNCTGIDYSRCSTTHYLPLC